LEKIKTAPHSEINVTKTVTVKLTGNEERTFQLSNFPKKGTPYSAIASLKALISVHDYQSIQGETLAVGDGNITFRYTLDGIDLERDIAVKVQEVANKFSPSKLKETLKDFLFKTNPILSSYASISPHEVTCCHELYTQALKLFSEEDKVSAGTPCLLVLNEHFFGKNFIFPSDFSLSQIVPTFPSNVLTCINLLKEEKSVLAGLSTVSKIKPEESFFTSDLIKYDEYAASAKSRKQFFRNVSFYWLLGKPVLEYTKGSYCKEHDVVLKDGMFAYIFGAAVDSNTPWNALISTQICFDLSSGIRAKQPDVLAPIHVIQSNRLDISQYVIHDAQKLIEKNHIPGQAQIIIHSDPSWPEVFVADGSFTKTLDLSYTSVDKKLHYKEVKSKGTFRFFIGAGGYRNAYTITHWILNEKQE
jgi:hypothetical protein